MILPIPVCEILLSLRHSEEMHPPQEGSCAKRAAPEKSLPMNNKKKEDKAVTVQSQISQKRFWKAHRGAFTGR